MRVGGWVGGRGAPLAFAAARMDLHAAHTGIVILGFHSLYNVLQVVFSVLFESFGK